MADLTTFGRSLIDDSNAAAAVATLGLDADLTTYALPASTTISAFGASLTDDSDAQTARATLQAGYTLQACQGAISPVDAVTTYFGGRHAALVQPARETRRYTCHELERSRRFIYSSSRLRDRTKTSFLYCRLNDATDTLISAAVTHDAGTAAFNNTCLSVAVAAGDYFEIKWVAPTWVTNPTNVSPTAVIYIE